MLHTSMTQKESIWGWAYLAFQLLVLPTMLQSGNAALGYVLSGSELNFVFFLINFIAVSCIFRRFFLASGTAARKRQKKFWGTVILGFAAYLLCNILYSQIMVSFFPHFRNLNDQNVGAMVGKEFLLMTVGTVILVPPVEEIFYRGLIFGKLFNRRPILAYVLSASLFSLIHIIGYLGIYSASDFLLAFLQYVPAGLILAWSYQNADSIYAPVLIHALVNVRGIWLMR